MNGLGFRLGFDFTQRTGSKPRIQLPPLSRQIEEVARRLAALPAEKRAKLLLVIESLTGLVDE